MISYLLFLNRKPFIFFSVIFFLLNLSDSAFAQNDLCLAPLSTVIRSEVISYDDMVDLIREKLGENIDDNAVFEKIISKSSYNGIVIESKNKMNLFKNIFNNIIDAFLENPTDSKEINLEKIFDNTFYAGVQNVEPLFNFIRQLINYLANVPINNPDEFSAILMAKFLLLENAAQHWGHKPSKFPPRCIVVFGNFDGEEKFSVITSSEFCNSMEEATLPRGERGKGTGWGKAISETLPNEVMNKFIEILAKITFSSGKETAVLNAHPDEWLLNDNLTYVIGRQKEKNGALSEFSFKPNDWTNGSFSSFNSELARAA